MENFNFVNLYFQICIYVWILDVIIVAAVAAIKPLRMWCWKKYCELAKEFMKICLAVWPELMEDEDENL